PKEHVVKCLVQYHPDDTVANRLDQEAQLLALYDAVKHSGHELLLEVIPPKRIPGDENTIVRAMKRLYNIGIYPEWWKLESLAPSQWSAVDALIAERDPYCRGVVLLGLNAPMAELATSFRQAAASATCRGFMVGRTIFQEPSRRWLAGEVSDQELVAAARANFESLVSLWRHARNAATGRAA
ncbi:MAG TPA: DUF2090 domain-containing protein, partial [Noviherbaspirillum sp.]